MSLKLLVINYYHHDHGGGSCFELLRKALGLNPVKVWTKKNSDIYM